MKKNKVDFCIVYGSGGHQEQARRLVRNILSSKGLNMTFFSIRDTESTKIKGDYNNYKYDFVIPPFRDKYSKISTFKNLILNFLFTPKMLFILLVYRPSFIISPGPGCAIPIFIIGKLLGIRTIYVESWSRFYKLSWTGKLMLKFSSDFWYQNIDLKDICRPDAIWVGRL